MGTKNNPGKFDCYAAAKDDEPMFVLLGRDPIAPFLVGLWAGLKTAHDPDADEEKVREALLCAQAMDEYVLSLNREDKNKLRELIMAEGLRIAQAIEKDAPATEEK